MTAPAMRAVELSAALAARGHLVPIGVAEGALVALGLLEDGGPTAGLTRRQRETMLVIQEAVDRDGVAPSREELRRRLDLASVSQSQRLIERLEARGYLRRLPYQARALEILRRVPVPGVDNSLKRG